MNSTPSVADITPAERALLSRLRFCPGAFLGEPSLRNFRHMSAGYRCAMQTAMIGHQHNLLPEGLNEFTARLYGGDMGTRDCFSIIALHEPDDAKALDAFFTILDEYLTELDYAPLSRIESWEEFRTLWAE